MIMMNNIVNPEVEEVVAAVAAAVVAAVEVTMVVVKEKPCLTTTVDHS